MARGGRSVRRKVERPDTRSAAWKAKVDAVRRVLEMADGARVIKADMMRATGLAERCVRLVIRDLIMEEGIPVVADNFPAGYRILRDPGELDVYCLSLIRRGVAILSRASKLRKIPIREIAEQGILDFEGGWTEGGYAHQSEREPD